jgi:hypothetical protein
LDSWRWYLIASKQKHGGWILKFVKDKLDKQQFGENKGRSTTHALVDILHHWHQAVEI